MYQHLLSSDELAERKHYGELERIYWEEREQEYWAWRLAEYNFEYKQYYTATDDGMRQGHE